MRVDFCTFASLVMTRSKCVMNNDPLGNLGEGVGDPHFVRKITKHLQHVLSREISAQNGKFTFQGRARFFLTLGKVSTKSQFYFPRSRPVFLKIPGKSLYKITNLLSKVETGVPEESPKV